MEPVTGVFPSRRQAEEAFGELTSVGIATDRIGLLTPGMTERQVETSVRTTDSEEPGMGKTMGATVGAAIGVAGGASLGAATATLLVPGVGPVVAVGLIGAALFGLGGAAAGAKVGDSLEERLGEGLPHEDLYLYEYALRRGQSAVVVFAEDGAQADRVREIMSRNGSEDLEVLRENWWRDLKNGEQQNYQTHGGDFERDELSYRRGFQCALHPGRRGKLYLEVEHELRVSYGDKSLDSAFRHGYERGRDYLEKLRDRKA